MKAIVYTRYGPPDVLQLAEVVKPAPKDDEVLIKIHATTVTSGDVRMRGLIVPPLLRLPMRIVLGYNVPKQPVLGVDLAGEVEATGNRVTRFAAGDRVFGSAYGTGSGTYAQYICMPEDAVLANMPPDENYEDAAAIFFGAHTALHFLRKGNVQAGHKVLIYGASGAVGTYAIQIAKHFGAQVTGVCSTANLELASSLGADRVIDYSKEDFTKSGEAYDVIFDTVGKSPFSGSIRSLKDNGIYLRAVHMELPSIIRGLWTQMTSGKKVIGGVAHERTEDLLYLRDLIEAGKLRPVIDRTYPLEDIVEAHRYVEAGHKKGNVVIIVKHET